MLFGTSFLSIYHEDTHLRLSFSALPALRSWMTLDQTPPRVQSAWKRSTLPSHMSQVPMFDFDYTFTTPYAGNIEMIGDETVESLPVVPDTSTFVQRKVQDVERVGEEAKVGKKDRVGAWDDKWSEISALPLSVVALPFLPSCDSLLTQHLSNPTFS